MAGAGVAAAFSSTSPLHHRQQLQQQQQQQKRHDGDCTSTTHQPKRRPIVPSKSFVAVAVMTVAALLLLSGAVEDIIPSRARTILARRPHDHHSRNHNDRPLMGRYGRKEYGRSATNNGHSQVGSRVATALLDGGFSGSGRQLKRNVEAGVSIELVEGEGNDGYGPDESSAVVGHVTVEVNQPGVKTYPSVLKSTVLFLHIFKCAGTTLRQLFTGWAGRMGGKGAIVVECKHVKRVRYRPAGKVCLDRHNQLIATKGQQKYIKGQKVLAGHFFWGFQDYAAKPYLMITTLRSPLELAVSAQQFMHRAETATMEKAVAWISTAMQRRIDRYRASEGLDVGFLRRLVDPTVPGEPSNVTRQDLSSWGNNAVENLQTFWVVGVVEQYDGLLAVLHRLMDPYNFFPELWEEAHTRKENSSPVSSKNVLRNLDPQLVSEFNATILALQWEVYDAAVSMWDQRCREVLPRARHRNLCTVPAHPTSYATT